ncbi:MAG: metallophosphoesterase [Nocardioidaceae bacterium]
MVVDLQLAGATAASLPAACLTGGGHTSSLAADGLRARCDLGPVPADQEATASIELTVGPAAPQIAVQAGPYDNAGTVLVHEVSGVADVPYYRLLSSPDFLNADIADLSVSRWDHWEPGMPNSWNPVYETALDKILADWAAFHPDAVSVIGDLVNGRWIKDPDRLRMFGPVDTPAHRRQTIALAATTYYTAWVQRFTDADLQVFPGIGDHDLGDNPWKGSRLFDQKRRDAGLYRSLFAKYLTTNPDGSARFASRPVGSPWELTSYAVRPDPEVQLVMLDVFRSTKNNVVAEVGPAQLAWLKGVLAKAQADGVDWIMVQGHVPVLGPVRRGPSSGLMYRHGSHSALWALFEKYGVDVYFSGEVHASTAIVRDGIAQVSHGGNVGYGGTATSRGGTSFVVADFSAGELSMRLFSWNRTQDDSDRLWQMAGNRIPVEKYFNGPPVQIGSLTITNNGSSSVNHPVVVARTGVLTPFDPATEPGPWSPELP